MYRCFNKPDKPLIILLNNSFLIVVKLRKKVFKQYSKHESKLGMTDLKTASHVYCVCNINILHNTKCKVKSAEPDFSQMCLMSSHQLNSVEWQHPRSGEPLTVCTGDAMNEVVAGKMCSSNIIKYHQISSNIRRKTEAVWLCLWCWW